MPCIPLEQTLRQPASDQSSNKWSEDMFYSKQQPNPLLTSTSNEEASTHEPEPEVAPIQFTEEPFAHPTM
ncbi:hypothetical protein O181_069773 [Austropuccinia psidii MF-1]|uniref:Uncharacterized protein n=1 Tax=Austropuccinia psidii MF-1 TaxID=1389203 RepID=A0A9Q3EXU4_9BASI|nr:hypothetical protein [Austropuccinia psidii MF-1]